MKIISYNSMGLENKDIVLSTIYNLAQTTDSFALCIQDSGDISFYDISHLKDVHIKAFKDMDSLHKPNMLTLSSAMTSSDCERVSLPRVNFLIWKVLFSLFYKSEVPQNVALITRHSFPNGSEFVLVNVHFDVIGGFNLKIKQIKKIKESLENINTERVVIVGDFNLTSLSKVKEIAMNLGENYKVYGDTNVVTSSIKHTMSQMFLGKWFQPLLKLVGLASFFDSRRDWIITKNIEVTSEKVLTNHTGSDHYPVVYEVE